MGIAEVRMPPRVARGADGVGRESADRHMIRMDVESVRVERQHDRRSMTTDERHKGAAHLFRRCRGELLVAVVEDLKLVDTHYGRDVPQLLLTAGRHLLGRANWRIAGLSPLAPGR